jgi:chromosome segregation ATPase
MKAAQREANVAAAPAPAGARPESSRRKEREEAAAAKVRELEAALKAAEAQAVIDKEAVQQAEAARDSIARQLITASQSVAYLKAEQARLHADLANAQATEAALVDSADGEHEALYYQLQEANQNASNLTYYMNLANQRVMQLEQQAKEYEQDMRRMKKKLKKRAERQHALLERPSSSLTPSEYGDEENNLASHPGATLKALPAPKPAQPPGYAGRHRDHRYD